MSRFLLVLAALPLSLAACTPADQRTALGVAGGAAVGAAVSSDDDRTKAPQSGKCYYKDQYGQTFIANCQ